LMMHGILRHMIQALAENVTQSQTFGYFLVFKLDPALCPLLAAIATHLLALLAIARVLLH
jgi:hypothetical protein